MGTDRVLLFILFGVVAILIVLLIDGAFAHPTPDGMGVVVEKVFTPEQNSVGTGVGVVDGKTAVVITNNHQDEVFTVFVDRRGAIVETRVSRATYFRIKYGDEVQLFASLGAITGLNWGETIK